VAQRAQVDMQLVADFVDSVNTRVRDHNIEDAVVINMDQTAIYFDMVPKRVISPTGVKTVRTPKARAAHGGRATVCCAVTKSGHKLPCLVIFKGTSNGRLARAASAFTEKHGKGECVFAYQSNSWCDERTMLLWVEAILKPYMQKHTAPGLVMLDAFKVHQMGSVHTAIQMLGCLVCYLPAGTTSACQVLDVGVNKPFKDLIRKGIREEMTRQQMIENSSTATIGREEIANIISDAWKNISYSTIINTFKTIGFYF
jgi:DDE superfamily endonuclease